MKYQVKVTFTEPILGTAPQDKEIYSNYILDSLAHEDEVETVRDEKGRTGFHRNEEGTPILYDYMIRGFFKDACGMLTRSESTLSKKLRAYKKIIDGLVFVFPRRIPMQLAGDLTVLERPLRAQTAQGERVALAASDMAPAGTAIQFEIDVLDDASVTEAVLREWLDYGRYRGIGQWRNGSYGRFSYELNKA